MPSLLLTTNAKVRGQALGMQELAIGIMPPSLILGISVQQFGAACTTQVSALLLTVAMIVLALCTPEFIRSSGRDR